MTGNDRKKDIIFCLNNFSQNNLLQSSKNLFFVLGYHSKRLLSVKSKDDYRNRFILNFNSEKLLYSDWLDAQFLFELRADDLSSEDTEITADITEGKDIEAYWFIAIELCGETYTKKQLSDITREINKQRSIPAFILFKYNNKLTFSIIDRRLNKKDSDKDVLEKVVLIKDINFENPHRAHIDILHDLSFENIRQNFKITNFVDLHLNWLKTLNISELNKRFYKELSNWFFWAIDTCKLSEDNTANENVTFGIRMITRIIFNWFIKEKGLINEKVFDKRTYLDMLKPEYKEQGDLYYKVILQNLFFGCLSKPMDRREFRSEKRFQGKNTGYDVNNLLRYAKYINNPQDILDLFKDIPFLNGGLFECSDDKRNETYIDCFTDNDSKSFLKIPDEIFFMEEEKNYNLSKYFDNEKKYKNAKVRGLFSILNSYKFTIDETTPIEEEIALDPELLGRVFENLLAAHNPETKQTARKSTGSYYTPREIVDYMCEQSLMQYLKTQAEHLNVSDIDNKLKELLSYKETHSFNENEVNELIKAVNNVKILDPACGSGAFPMGLLHKLVHVLSKLDPHNNKWKESQIKKAEQIDDFAAREEAINIIEKQFNDNELDYSRKLYLIQNCIFGVDIQPMATQISRLRFFISLIVDEKPNKNKENMGILALPNLETKFVAANTLIDLPERSLFSVFSPLLIKLKNDLEKLRTMYFRANNSKKKTEIQNKDREIREQIKQEFERLNVPKENAEKLADWNPYDKDKSSEWFSPKWMFGTEKFDIVISNPPYVPYKQVSKSYSLSHYKAYNNRQVNKPNLYVYFIENSFDKLLKQDGILSFINPIAFLVQSDCISIRKMILSKQINELLDLSYINVFKEADTYTVIINMQNSNNNKNFKYQRYYSISDIYNQDKYVYPINYIKKDSESKIILSEHLDLLNKINNKYPNIIDNFANIVCGTSKESFNKEVSTTMSYSNAPVLQSSDIQKYRIDWLNKYIEKNIFTYEKIKNYFLTPKIVMARMTENIRCSIDKNNYYCAKINILVSKDKKNKSLKILLAILNSTLMNFLYKETYRALHKKGDVLGFDIPSIKKLPVPNIYKDCDYLSNMVDKIFVHTEAHDYLSSTEKQNKVKEYEKQIDLMVYKLYDLTHDEILAIDKDFSL